MVLSEASTSAQLGTPNLVCNICQRAPCPHYPNLPPVTTAPIAEPQQPAGPTLAQMTATLQHSDQSYLSQMIAEQGKSQIPQTVFQDNLKNLENSRQLLK